MDADGSGGADTGAGRWSNSHLIEAACSPFASGCQRSWYPRRLNEGLQQVQLVVARWTGIPLEKLTQSDRCACAALLGTTCLHWSLPRNRELLGSLR
eukprot:COSAG01_NODE_1122_length_11627_cov_25.881725_15_plen_97_part_00